MRDLQQFFIDDGVLLYYSGHGGDNYALFFCVCKAKSAEI